ncbi:hypothetical protein [Agromyces humi]|uniref:hypothetical protein n=1 Tax=Agromyces humi TaxID=1766800 RepID=UPI00135A00A2|nr:hypothetical protein [Agromyces humi]
MNLHALSFDDLAVAVRGEAHRLGSGIPVDRTVALSNLRALVAELTDREHAGVSFAESAPLDGLAEVIADAMWDRAGNRIGGPRAAADAVEAHLEAQAAHDHVGRAHETRGDRMPTNTRLAGHTLANEGAPFNDNGARIGYRGTSGEGRGKCSCGELSDVVASGGARRRWHADHKAEIAAKAATR